MDEGHTLTVEQCKRVTATQIESVDSFSEKQITLSYQGGRILITGDKMKIVNFSKTSGAFAATGVVLGARYLPKGGTIRQKLFR